MGIDQKARQPTRKLLGYAIRNELGVLTGSVETEGPDALLGSIPLCLVASAYIAVDASDRWPTDADLRGIAQQSAEAGTQLDIPEQEIYAYLSRVALGTEKPGDVFSAKGLAMIPLFATANLLVTFCPREKAWGEYLDQIWDAADAAERASLTMLPALILRAHKEPAHQGSSN